MNTYVITFSALNTKKEKSPALLLSIQKLSSLPFILSKIKIAVVVMLSRLLVNCCPRN